MKIIQLTKITVLIIIMAQSNFMLSQKIITGIVTNSLNQNIQYANVGVLNKSIGTVTNSKGEFIIELDNTLMNDTLKISFLGYKSKEFVIKSLSEKVITINLEKQVEELKEIMIIPRKTKTHIKGKKKSKSNNEVFFATPKSEYKNLGSEIGRKFSLGTKKISFLNEFKFYIKKNNFDNIKFRINLYNIKEKVPFKNINDENIFIEVSDKHIGWVKVDLKEYNISIKEDIIITVEWIKSSKKGNELSLPILIPSFSSTHFYKYGSQAKWRRYKSISSAMVLKYKQ
ncbi:MAG TPA: carboxypeptidase-like regulatory domain-containing protein [Bacteroidia bacterium]|nr:carboxypeptidase-like regulatory domain-containing protein [Bacteroidia bacterium]